MPNTIEIFNDAEFRELPEDRRASVLTNYFDRELADEEFAGLPEERQQAIRTNFISKQLGEVEQAASMPVNGTRQAVAELPRTRAAAMAADPTILESEIERQLQERINPKPPLAPFSEPVNLTPLPETMTYKDALKEYARREWNDSSPEGINAARRWFIEQTKLTPEEAEKRTERGYLGKLKEAFSRGLGDVDVDTEGFEVALGLTDKDEWLAKRREVKQREEFDPIKSESWLPNAILQAARMSGPMGKGQIQGMIAGGAVGLATGGAGAPVAVAIGSGQYWFRQGFGDIYGTLLEQGVNDDIAAAVATGMAPAYAAIEFSQVRKIAPGLGNAAKKELTKATTRVVTRAITRFGQDIMTEAGEEALQEIILIAADEMGKELSNIFDNTQLKGTPIAESWKQVVSVFTSALSPMAILLAPKRIVGTASQASAKKKLESQVAQMSQAEREEAGLDEQTLQDQFGISKPYKKIPEEELEEQETDYEKQLNKQMEQALGAFREGGEKQPFRSITEKEAALLNQGQKELDETGKVDPETLRQLDEAAKEIDQPVGIGQKESIFKATEKPVETRTDKETDKEPQEEEITQEAQPLAGERAKTVDAEAEKPPSALAGEQARKAAEETDAEKKLAAAMEEEEIAQNLAEEEPITALNAEEIAQVNAHVERLGSIEAVAERYPDDGAVDRYARQRAERELGTETKSETKPQTEPAEPEATQAEPETKEETKQPWEMNFAGYLESTGYKTKQGSRVKENWRGQHEGIIRTALEQKKPVPEEVLADYPDLAEKYGEKKESTEKLPVYTHLTKAKQNSANRIESAVETIQSQAPKEQVRESQKRRKDIENAYESMKLHAGKLDLTIPQRGTYYDPVKDLKDANKLLAELRKKHGKQKQAAPSVEAAPEQREDKAKVVKEALAEQSKDNRRKVLQNRIRQSKDVSKKLLEEFRGEDWADDLLGESEPRRTFKQESATQKMLIGAAEKRIVDLQHRINTEDYEPDGEGEDLAFLENRVVEERDKIKKAEAKIRDIENYPLSFSTVEATPSANRGRTAKFVERVVAPFREKFITPINVVQSVNDLPKSFQEEVRAQMKKGGLIRGIFDRDTEQLWLIADSMGVGEQSARKDVIETALHETVGHFGLRKALGSEIDKFYRKELIGHKDYGPVIQDIADRWSLTPEEAAEEWFAGQVEQGVVEPTLMQRLIAAIRRALKALGIELKYSKSELSVLIDRAYRAATDRRIQQARETAPELVPAFSVQEPQQWYYSQMQSVITNKLSGKGTAQSYRQTIESWANKGEFKREELEWSGLLDDSSSPLQQKGKLDKQQVIDWLVQNNVRVEEVSKGGELPDDWQAKLDELRVLAENADMDMGRALTEDEADELQQLEFEAGSLEDQTKFSAYQLPGGENYREALITLPLRDETMGDIALSLYGKSYGELTPEERSKVAEIRKSRPEKTNFTGSHWEEPNVLAHIRLNDRTDADGKRVLFIEEAQSDWHQKGREKGYRGIATKMENEIATKHSISIKPANWTKSILQEAKVPESTIAKWINEVATKRSVPNAPFKSTWPLLAMKKAIRIAAEEGYDAIAWTTGEQQADRYDLSKQVDNVRWTDWPAAGENMGILSAYKDGSEVIKETINKNEVDRYIGKEVTKRLLESEDVEIAPGTKAKEISGKDLKVGGLGMKTFYDKMLPSMVNKYVKKWGGKVDEGKTIKRNHYQLPVTLPNGLETIIELKDDNYWHLRNPSGYTWQKGNTDLQETIDKFELENVSVEDRTDYHAVHSLEITPAMHQATLSGQPLFRRNLDENLIQQELERMIELLDELPDMRNGRSTTGLQIRYAQKIAELEEQMQAVERGLKFSRVPEYDNPTYKEFLKKDDIEVTAISGKEIQGKTIKEASKDARRFAKVRFTGENKTAINRENSWEIDIPKEGIEEATSHAKKREESYEQHVKNRIIEAKAVAAVPKLLERAYRTKTEPDYKKRQDIKWVHHFVAPLVIGEDLYRVRLVVRETSDGQKYYDHSATQIESPPAFSPHRTQKRTRYGRPGELSLKLSIKDLMDEVNREDFEGDRPGFRFSLVEQPQSRLDKTIDQLNKNLPPKGKNKIVRHRLSTLIKQKVRNLKSGARLGRLDMAGELYEVKQLILEYARQNLPQTGITRGQIKPLLTQVARAKKAEDVADAFKRVDSISETVDEKQLKTRIDTLLNRYKPKKKQGRIRGTTLTASEYAQLDNIRAIATMKKEQVDNAMADIWAKIEARENDTEPTPFESEYMYMLTVFGNLRGKSLAQLQVAREELESLIEYGRTKRQIKDEQRRERQRAVREKAIQNITRGKPLKSQEEIAEEGGDYEKGWFSRFDDLNQSFEYLLDKLSVGPGAGRFRGFLNKTFMPLVREARNNEHKYIREGMTALQEKLREIWGTTRPRELQKIMSENSEVVDTGIDIQQPQYTQELRVKLKNEEITRAEIPVKTVRLKLSQNQAYKKILEWQDPSLAGAFERMGYTQETIDALNKFVKPQLRQWADWQLSEFYPEHYGPINKVFKDLYDVDLPFNAFYSPISRIYGRYDAQDDQLLAGGNNTYSSVLNKHLYSRVKNKRPLKNVDGDVALANHVVEMAHFRAWAKTIRELRSAFSNEDVRTAIKQYHGPDMMRNIDHFINDMARGGVDPKFVKRFVDGLRKNFTTAVLGLNLTLIPKQLASIPAYAAEIPATDFVAGMFDFIRNPVKKAKILMGTEFMKARYHKGFERDIMLAMQRTTQQELAGKNNLRDLLMLPTKVGDAGAILMGGWSVYKHHHDQAIKQGKSEAQARKIGLEEFEASTSRSQQAGEVEDLPDLMRQGSWTRLLTMFVTAPNAYYRMESIAVRNLIQGRGKTSENLKKFAIAHFILPMIFQFVANGFKWRDDDQLRAVILGSLNGLLIVGQIAERTVQAGTSAAMGAFRYFYGSAENPVFDNLNDIPLAVGRMINRDYNNWKDITKTLDEIASIVSKIAGVPYDPVRRVTKGVGQVIEEPDEAESYLKAVGYSDFALGSKPKSNKGGPRRLRPVRSIREQGRKK